MSEENIDIDIELNADLDNLDTSQFWKSRDESTKITLNENLLRIARNGPCSEFVSVLENESSSRLDREDIYLIDLDIVDKSGWSPLIHASFNGHLTIVEHIISYQEQKYLKEYGDELILISDTDDEDSDNDNSDNSGNETSQKEEIHNHENPSELKRKYLFKKFLRRKVKWNGSTALHLACARGHELIAKLLISKMLNEYNMPYAESINAIDYDMATPLHCAVLGKHYNICKLLLLNGCVVNKSDIRGKTPLHWATERGLNQYISLLSSYAKEEREKQETVEENSITKNIQNSIQNSTNEEREREKVVESIWEANQEEKSMEPALSDNDIIKVVINSQNVIVGSNHNHQIHDNYLYSQQTQKINTDCDPNTRYTFNTYQPGPAPQTHSMHPPPPHPHPHVHLHPHTLHASGWYYNYPTHIHHRGPPPPPPPPPPSPPTHQAPTQAFHAPNMHHNTSLPHHNNNHHQYRQRAPRHQRYFNYNQQYQAQAPKNCPSVSVSPVYNMASTPPLLVTSKSCPTAAQQSQSEQIVVQNKIDNDDKNDNDNDNDKDSDGDAESEKENEKENENEETVENKMDDPAFDVMKFQNKYLKARCETLETEHKELATEYKQQLIKENNRWRLREEKLLQQLDTKQKQIHELRHTLRRMRMFLDNLPVRMRRNFYRNSGNFSRELYENQQVSNSENNNNKKNKNNNNYKMVEKEVAAQTSNITTNGWRTITTDDLNESKKNENENDNENQKQPQKQTQQNKKNNNANKNNKNTKNNKNKNNRFTDTFLFSKLSSNAARSRKCAMSDKSWRRKK